MGKGKGKGNGEEKKTEEKEPAMTTTVLKMNLHCQGCIVKIEKAIRKIKGVYDVKIDAEKDHVTVIGVMEIKAVQERLKSKMKRTSEIVPPKKDKEKEKEEKKDEKKAGAGEFAGMKYDYYGFSSGPDYGTGGHCPCCSRRPPFPPHTIFNDENPNACSVM